MPATFISNAGFPHNDPVDPSLVAMPPSQTFDPLAGNQKYEKVKNLGSGGYGLVVLGRNKVTKENVAIKFIERGEMAHCMSAPKTKVGTLAYMAPEVIETTTGYDGAAADIWSCGVMLYVMLFQHYPFESAEQAEDQRKNSIMENILAIAWSFPLGFNISEGCRDLLLRMLAKKDKRIKMEDLLQHPWFLNNIPPGALTMNEAAMGKEDYSKVQNEDEIKQLLKDAQNSEPNKYNFSSAATESGARRDSTATGVDANTVAATGVDANAVAATGVDANAVAATGVEANAVAATGVDANAVAATGVDANAVAATGVDANAVAATGVDANAVAATGVDANAVAATGVDANAVAATGVDAYAVAATGVDANAVAATGVDANAVAATGVDANAVAALTAS
eukprot:gene18565-25076_t